MDEDGYFLSEGLFRSVFSDASPNRLPLGGKDFFGEKSERLSPFEKGLSPKVLLRFGLSPEDENVLFPADESARLSPFEKGLSSNELFRFGFSSEENDLFRGDEKLSSESLFRPVNFEGLPPDRGAFL